MTSKGLKRSGHLAEEEVGHKIRQPRGPMEHLKNFLVGLGAVINPFGPGARYHYPQAGERARDLEHIRGDFMKEEVYVDDSEIDGEKKKFRYYIIFGDGRGVRGTNNKLLAHNVSKYYLVIDTHDNIQIDVCCFEIEEY